MDAEGDNCLFNDVFFYLISNKQQARNNEKSAITRFFTATVRAYVPRWLVNAREREMKKNNNNRQQRFAGFFVVSSDYYYFLLIIFLLYIIMLFTHTPQ